MDSLTKKKTIDILKALRSKGAPGSTLVPSAEDMSLTGEPGEAETLDSEISMLGDVVSSGTSTLPSSSGASSPGPVTKLRKKKTPDYI